MLLVYLSKKSPRSLFVLEWIFNRWGLDFEVTTNENRFENHTGPKIFYDKAPKSGSVFIAASGFLQDDSLKMIDINVSSISNLPVLFSNNSHIGFDVFSAVFYMISRYEEYLPFSPDEHGRFPASESIAFKNGFLEIPIVDLWIDFLQKHLKEVFPNLIFQQKYFKFLPTYDIDIAYKFRGRNLLQWSGGLGRSLLKFDFKNIFLRLQVLFDKKSDPWNVYDFLQKELKSLHSRFFFLVGERSNFDRNLSVTDYAMRRLIKHINTFSTIGLHPSYKTCNDIALLKSEKIALESSCGNTVNISRQHFLKFKMPETFLNLESAGFTEDYSMAFPETPGFRAGTAYPFFFYDLKNERVTKLRLFPSCWMDFTFSDYLKTSWDEAFKKLLELVKEIKNTGGIFIPIFHNSGLEDPELKKLHSGMIAEILKDKKAI